MCILWVCGCTDGRERNLQIQSASALNAAAHTVHPVHRFNMTQTHQTSILQNENAVRLYVSEERLKQAEKGLMLEIVHVSSVRKRERLFYFFLGDCVFAFFGLTLALCTVDLCESAPDENGFALTFD
jgi:predicted phage tail protein